MIKSGCRFGHQVARLWTTSARKCSTQREIYPKIPSLAVQFPRPVENLSSTSSTTTRDQCVTLLYKDKVPLSEYRLPTVISNSLYKKTIVDPLHIKQNYTLPAFNSIVLEKFTPSIEKAPVEDPAPQGRPLVEKRAAWLVKIRKKKMKKHKLRKLRKKMIFHNRKLAEIRARKKEKILNEQKLQYKTWGDEFSAEVFVEEQIMKAKKGGWAVNIMK